jgi:hypothetical protein
LRQVDVLVSQGARELRAGSIGTSCVDHPSQSLADVRFAPECVAKLSLRRWANRDSVGLRR